ncbi:3D domain-containing protein [Melissococcus sp. OM08-11BH]|uniref:3D domain-containing protein n=1 Tax=Melissococcus sp. OM08-11BH TaxID=2293110 RepID=UPI0011C10884|nr:3D domain-containing protein [Melissococcus sp. OM08-11BH]
MNYRKTITGLLCFVMLTSMPVSLFAATKEEDVKKQSVEISEKIDSALDNVNKNYIDLENLKSEVVNTETKILSTQQQIEKTKRSMDKRKELIASRMKTIQTNQQSTTMVDTLLNANSVSDFINRAYAMSVLQTAEKSKIDTLETDTEKLEKLREELVMDQQMLSEKQSKVETDKAALESQVNDLKKELADNEATLKKLSEERVIKEAQAAKEKELAKKAQEAKETTKVNTNNSSSMNEIAKSENNNKTEVTNSTNATPVSTDKPASSGNGRVLTMQSTAYSYSEAGLTPYTATGIDLRQNSRVIAVDPSVIPLNSLVEVSGYGFAVAGDTGGAIKGNIIDVHFSTVAECLQWGRRTVTVTVQ